MAKSMEDLLKAILEAVYGEEVRGSIHDALKEIDSKTENFVEKEPGKGLSSNDFTDDEKESLRVQGLMIADPTYFEHQTNRVKEVDSKSTDKEYPTAKCVYNIKNLANQGVIDAHDAMSKATSAYNLAQEKFSAKAYADYSTLCDELLNTEIWDLNTLKIGQPFLIRKKDVPDVWVYNTNPNYQGRKPDEGEITYALDTNGYFDVGYARLAALETRKIDLRGYEMVVNRDDSFVHIDDEHYPTTSAVKHYVDTVIGDLSSILEELISGNGVQ